MNYQKLLKSPEWKKKSKSIKTRDNFKCRVCGTNKKLNVHHLIYYENKEPWKYKDKELITLCQLHHEVVHNYLEYASKLINKRNEN